MPRRWASPITSLPHKPQETGVWRREGHNLTLLLQAGLDSSGQSLGLPYGSYARFILLFLQSEAVKTKSREIELGRSMRTWLATMGLAIGGKTYRLVGEQARRTIARSLKNRNKTEQAHQKNAYPVYRRGG